MKNIRVFIITEGGSDLGLGHITRCLSLYQGFEDEGMNPKMIIKGDETVASFVKDINFSVFDWLNNESKILNIVDGADIVIIDSYLAGLSFYEKISESVKTPVYLDDNKRVKYPHGVVINGNIHAGKFDYPEEKNINYLLGTRYIPLRKEFWDVAKTDVKENIENVMITFGADDRKDITPGMLKLLVENYPAITKNVVVGSDFQNIEAIKKTAGSKTNLIYYPDAEQMRDIMKEADIAISAGGQTLYEFARVGVPTAVVSVAENQLNNIEGCQKAGFIEYIGKHSDKRLFENMKNLLERLHYKKRKTIDQIGRRCVDGQGARRVVKELLARHVKLFGKNDEE